MAPPKYSARLEVSGGKSATFERRRSECKGRIVVKYSQDACLTVYQVAQGQTGVCLAFCFDKKYFLGVEGEKICFEIKPENMINDLTNKFLFNWASNKDSYGSLSSVAEPSRYLCVHGKNVTLGSKPDHHFKVIIKKEDMSQKRTLCISETVGKQIARNTRMQCERLSNTVDPPIKAKKQSRKRKLCY